MEFQSPSSVGLFHDCPNAYRLHYIDRYKPLSIDDTALRMGRSVHSICENFYKDLNLNSTEPEKHFVEHLKNVAFAYWDRSIDAKKREEMDVALRGWVHVELTRFIKYRTMNILDRFKPVAVEEDLKSPLLGLHCIVDKRGIGADGSKYAWDYKTNSYLPSKKAFEGDMKSLKLNFKVQAVMNAMVLKAVGTPIDKFYFQFVRFPDKLLEVPLTPAVFKEAQAAIDAVLTATEYPKNKKFCFLCNYKVYCEAEQSSIYCCNDI